MPKNPSTLNSRELATVLAALRHWQDRTPAFEPVDSIATDAGRFAQLNRAEIDALCERLNCEDDDPRLAAYSRLHDMLSETIESGRLKRADIPDDYEAIVETLVQCAALNCG